MGIDTTSGGGVFLRATFVMVAAAAVFAGNEAAAGVGVTTAADGRPLGKPPNANERVLRIGIDVQANELVTTGTQDRAHLVFIDGSSLTVGPNARLTIDKFVFDPSTRTGELAVNASKGLFRLVGGKISKNTPITITTPSSTIGIRGGITIVAVTPTQTTADFIFGTSMTVTAGGRTQTATRPGSQVITAFGGVPGAPTLLKPGSLTATLAQLEGGRSNNRSPDQTAQSSGFSNQNSGQAVNVANINQNEPPNPSNNILTTAVSDTNPASNPRGNATPLNANSSSANPPPTPPVNPPKPPPPTPPPPTPTRQTLTGFATGLVVVEMRGGESRPTVVTLNRGTASITTGLNNQAKGTIGASYGDATASVQLNGTAGPPTVMTASTVKIGNSTVPIKGDSVLVSASNPHCRCEFLKWGAWKSTVPDPRDNGITYTGYGTYVAGTPTVQLPNIAEATYKGFMAGFATKGGTPYAATGTYQNAWNFRTGSGNFNGSFDGTNYSGTTKATGNGTAFSGDISGGNRRGSLNGGFFDAPGPGNAAKYQAGTFSIGGGQSQYQATGVFAGQR